MTTPEALKAAREALLEVQAFMVPPVFHGQSPEEGSIGAHVNVALAKIDAALAALAALAEPHPRRSWSEAEAEAVEVAHRAGFAGTAWRVGPEELVHLLNLIGAPHGAALAEQQAEPQAAREALEKIVFCGLSALLAAGCEDSTLRHHYENAALALVGIAARALQSLDEATTRCARCGRYEDGQRACPNGDAKCPVAQQAEPSTPMSRNRC